ncbi:MAG: hypothetical protein EOM76_01350 [Sphingobacteriia bacterium]|nr:hypothetical protein [Sphingobacteriia bacterium]
MFLGTNNHNGAAMYIAKNMHQLYELSGASTIDSIIVNSKVANVPTHRGGMGGQVPDNAATVHGFQVNDTSTTAPHNVHLYAFSNANGAISYVMEEEVTFGLIGDAGIAHGWDPENPVVFKKISDNLYYTRITVLNDSSKERRFTIMHKNKKYPNWNEHNRLDGDRYTQWATVTKGAGVQNVSGKTIFEPSTAFSRGDVVGVVVKYKDTTDYNSYVANNSYTLYVDSMKYRLKVDVGDVTYTSNKLFGDGTFSIYAPQNTNIYLQGWLANEWVNIGEPFQYTTDSTVIKVTFTFDTETLGTPVKYEYPEGFYIRTNIATGGTTDYTNPTKNNAMTRFARAGETLDDYYWVTDIKAGTNNVKAVVANVYNPEITNWEATAQTASSASAIRFLYNTRNNQLERVQAKSGTLTAGGYSVTVDSTNHWATKVEIPDYNGNSTTLTSTGDTGLSTLSKTVPAQTGFDGAMTLGIDYDFKTDKLSNPQWVVRNDENFTVATTKTSAPNVLVRDSGQVTGTVTGSGTITIEKNYSLTTSGVTTRNHWISFPFAVNINEITGDSICHGVLKYDLQSKYGSLWRIVYYNTALKGSTNGASAPYWTKMANTATLEAGKGYVLQFTNKVTGQPKFYYHSASNYTMNDAAQGSMTLTATTGTNANHQNWYLIGNPFFAKTKINGGPLCWVRVNSDYSNYDYYLARDYNELPTSTSFFVQYAGDVTFTTKATNAASPAPMLAAQENDGFEYYLLTLSNNSIKKRLGVILSDDGSNDYVYGRDMALMAEDASIVRFYSINGYNLAFNNIKKQNQTVALGYYTTTAGTHTISIAQKDVPEDSRVILYDAVTDKSTDMMADNYTFTTEAGTFDSRFTLYIYKTTTGCTQAINPEWIIRQEEQNLIIENVTSGDKLQLFHISGKCVAQITADNTTVCFPNLTEGMYILTANNKQTKIVIK